MNKSIHLIVAHDICNGISKQGVIPWKSKKDLSFFTLTTKSTTNFRKRNALIMGSKTFNFFKRELVAKELNRTFYVLTRNDLLLANNGASAPYANVTYVEDISTAIKMCNERDNIETIFACSNVIYDYVLEKGLVDKIYATKIGGGYDCDNRIRDYLEGQSIYSQNVIKTDIDEENVEINEIILNGPSSSYNIANAPEQKYLDLMANIIQQGDQRQTRNGMTYSMFGSTLSFNLEEGFPLFTTKKVYFKGMLAELIDLFLKGKTDTTILTKQSVNIWKGNTSKDFLEKRGLFHYCEGEMGPMYGYNWRFYGKAYDPTHSDPTVGTHIKCVDQLRNVINLLINDPFNRAIMMTTYDPSVVDQSVLNPCHGIITQFYVRNTNGKYYLDCQTYQRSADMLLGVPFNVASYAALMHILTLLCKPNIAGEFCVMRPGILTTILGDAHVYEQHIAAVYEQVARKTHKFPSLSIKQDIIDHVESIYNSDTNIVDKMIGIIDEGILKKEHMIVNDYFSCAKICAPMIA